MAVTASTTVPAPLDQVVVACIVLKEGSCASEDDIRSFLGMEELAGYMAADLHRVEVYDRGSIVVAYTTVQSFKAFDLILGLGGNPPKFAAPLPGGPKLVAVDGPAGWGKPGEATISSGTDPPETPM